MEKKSKFHFNKQHNEEISLPHHTTTSRYKLESIGRRHCNQKKDQSSCDGLGCSWYRRAVSPSCYTIANAAKLPSAVFKCDKTLEASSDSTILDLVENDSSLERNSLRFRSSGTHPYLEKSNVTLFAASNQALQDFPDYKLKYILQNKNSLTSILKYNIVPESISADDLKSLASSGTDWKLYRVETSCGPLRTVQALKSAMRHAETQVFSNL